MKRIVLFVACCAAAAHANSCITIASSTPGNWSAPATWLKCGGTYPGAGDTFAISRPVVADVDAVVGPSPADTSSTITGPSGEIIRNDSGAGGFLTVAAGVSFTMRGSVRLTSGGRARASVLLQAGSTWMFDNSAAADPATTIYRFYPSAEGALSDVMIQGSAVSRATVRGKVSSCGACANAIFFQSNTGGASGSGAAISLDAQYADFYDVGSGARGGIEFALAYAGQYFRMSHCTMARTGGLQHAAGVASASPTDGSQDFVLEDVKTTASLQTSLRVTSAQYLTMSSGRFRIANSYFDAGFAGGLSGATLDHDVFDGTFEPVDSVAYTPASAYRVVVHQAKLRGTFAAWHGSATDLYTYMDSASDATSPKFWKVDPGSTQKGWVFEYGNKFVGAGAICLEANGALASGSITLQNIMVMTPAQIRDRASCRAVHSGTTGDSWSIYHSFLVFGPGPALYYDSGAANKFLNVRSNIFYDVVGGRTNPVSATLATATLNHFSAAGISNNAVYHAIGATRWTNSYGACATAGCTSNGTPYDVPVNSAVPGAGDVYADPVVNWRYRKLAGFAGFREWANGRYATRYDAGTTYTDCFTAANQFAALGADANLAAAIDDLFRYVHLYWAPINMDLNAAAHDGQDIGPSPMAESKYRAYEANRLPDGMNFGNSETWALYFGSTAKLAGTATAFDGVFLRLTPGSPATVPGLATNCYVFHDGNASDFALLNGASAVDGCIFDIGGSASGVSMIDARSGMTASHSIVLPTMFGQYAGPLARNANASLTHNTCWYRCLEPGDPATQTSTVQWPPTVPDGSADPRWYDFKRNLALFDTKYLGNTAARWSPTQTYAVGAFVSYSKAGVYWGEPVNFRYANGPGCGGANPEPLAAAEWRSCWEYASLYRIRTGLPDPKANPPRSTLDVYDDQVIGVHGDDPITVLVKWVRAGYAPTNPAYTGAASDGYDGGAMPVLYSDQLTPAPRSLSPARSVAVGGGLVLAGTAKVQK